MVEFDDRNTARVWRRPLYGGVVYAPSCTNEDPQYASEHAPVHKEPIYEDLNYDST